MFCGTFMIFMSSWKVTLSVASQTVLTYRP